MGPQFITEYRMHADTVISVAAATNTLRQTNKCAVFLCMSIIHHIMIPHYRCFPAIAHGRKAIHQLCQTQFLHTATLLDKAKSKGSTSECKGFVTTAMLHSG